ncbi:TPA: histidine kinase [Pseudomonas aeruginosa]|uniref:cache domain-containing protein n=1 Tax=Pseudomonas TaxID=286 RepID=UPI0018D620CE|nr:cache domain-containing protein [Pseudomonas putida]MBH3470257.1 PDC sensor domain-containing protein [Pseudomonas putida]HBP6163714.1 histidine kinase [Pseudomonas aeruginosa]
MTSTELDQDTHQCAHRLEAIFGKVFEHLETLAEHVVTVWDAITAEGNKPTIKDLAFLQATIKERLSENDTYIHGTGVVVEPEELADQTLFLEWFYRTASGKIAPMVLNFNHQSETFYNYQSMPWFTRPKLTGRASVEGPFVDLYGTELYILAFSVPIFANGHFVGVAAADVALHEFDQLLTRCLLHMPTDAFVINGEGRIVAANSSNWCVGNLAGRPAGANLYQLRPLSLDWTLVVLPDPQ